MVSSLHFLLQCSFWMSVSRRHCALDPVNVSHTHIHREPAVLRGHMAKWGRGPGVSQDWCAAVEAPGRRGRVEGQRAASAGQTGGVHGGSAHKSTHHVLVDLTFRWFEKKPQTNNKKNKQNGLPFDDQNLPLRPNWTGGERGSAFPVRDLLLQLLRSV